MINNKDFPIIVIVLIASAALHAGMLATGYMQEDAFITFRTAFNLADHGIYSFNLDERYPGATSLFFGFLVALVRYLGNDSAIVIVSLINIFSVLAGGYLLTVSVKNSWMFSRIKESIPLAIVLLSATASPALLKISSSGMETACLFFMICLSLWAISKNNLYVLCGSLALLPFVRIDSAGFCLIVLVCLFFQSKRTFLAATLAFMAGFGLLLWSNALVFDSFLPLTAQAKSISYNPDKSVLAIFERFLDLMFTNSFLLGVSTKYIPSYLYVLISLTFLVPTSLVVKHLYDKVFLKSQFHNNQKNLKQSSNISQEDVPVYVIALATVLIPLAYSLGGVSFPWYLWPFSSLAFVLLIGFCLRTFLNNVSEYFCLALIACLAALTLFININISEQESRYRASIGRYIEQISNPNDTLFLEPAGYIPFYAGIKTYDTVGLTSPKILNFHTQHGGKWWVKFVFSETPSFIVDRSPIHLSKATADGNYNLNGSEYAWFMNNYVLEAAFNYEQYLDMNQTSLFGIHRLGSSSDYFLYKRKSGSPSSR